MMLNIKTRKELWFESTLERGQNCDYCSPLPVRYFDSSIENEVWVSQESLIDLIETFGAQQKSLFDLYDYIKKDEKE